MVIYNYFKRGFRGLSNVVMISATEGQSVTDSRHLQCEEAAGSSVLTFSPLVPMQKHWPLPLQTQPWKEQERTIYFMFSEPWTLKLMMHMTLAIH